MTKPELSEYERLQLQPTSEWLADYEGDSDLSRVEASQVTNIKLEAVNQPKILIAENIKNAGITAIRRIDDKLLIRIDRPVTNELDSKIKKNIQHLVKFAVPVLDHGESFYIYSGYRTFMSNRREFLAITFNNISTGEIAERYFGTYLRSSKGVSFKTGVNCQFRVKGNIKRLQEGMFLKFWLEAVKQIPDNRLAHIYRYMNSKLSDIVVSCSNSVPHHGFTKLKKLKYEGHQYQIT